MREIRCSSLSRYMKCPGFAKFRDLPESETNLAAEEGTAAGELLQAMLEQRTTKPNVATVAKNNYRFDSDMYFHVTPIAQEILDKNVQVFCEQRIDWQAHQDVVIRGQFDICYQIGDTLHIEDLKYGWVLVDVEENWQLLGYAIGKVLQMEIQLRPKFIEFKIHQPRPHHEDGRSREWKISLDEMIGYHQKIVVQMELIANNAGDLVTGSHCKYCPAAGQNCTAFNKAVNNALDVTMSEFKQDSLNESQIADQLIILQRASELIKIKYDSLDQLACSKLKEGKLIPGFGLEEKYGDRSWLPDVSPDVIQMITGKDIIEKVMMTPAKAEKMGVNKKMVESLVTRKFTGVKCVKKDFSKDAAKVFAK